MDGGSCPFALLSLLFFSFYLSLPFSPTAKGQLHNTRLEDMYIEHVPKESGRNFQSF